MIKPLTARGGFFQQLSKRFGRLNKTDFPQPIVPEQQESSNVSSNVEHAAFESTLYEKITLPFLVRMWGKIKEHFLLSAGMSGDMSQEDFIKICRSQLDDATLEDENLLRKLYKRVDRKNTGAVRTVDIATTMILICAKATPLEKLQLLFRIFGADDDSCLTPDEIFDLYLNIKTNDLTKDPKVAQADMIFADELSLQEAKRIYELTVTTMLSGREASDFVILDEFLKVFEAHPYLLDMLLPGSFSLHWVLHNIPEEQPVSVSNQEEVAANFVKTLRKGEEHLNLSQPRGRGRRIVFGTEMVPLQRQSAQQHGKQSFAPKRKMVPEPKDKKITSPQQRKGKLPKLESSKRDVSSYQPQDSELLVDQSSDSESNDDDLPQHRVVARKQDEKRGSYNIEKAQLPSLPWLSMHHKSGTLFRALAPSSHQTSKPWRGRGALEHRKLQYMCLVCGIQHEFNQTRGAEHNHE